MCKTKQNAHQITSLQNSCNFFRVFQACKTQSGHPFPRRACLPRVSGSPLAAWNASLRWPKKREKMTPVLQSIRLQITDLNPFVRWLKKRKQIACSGKKEAAYPSEWRLTCVMSNRNTRSFFDGKERRSFGRESLTLWMCFVIRDSKSKWCRIWVKWQMLSIR